MGCAPCGGVRVVGCASLQRQKTVCGAVCVVGCVFLQCRTAVCGGLIAADRACAERMRIGCVCWGGVEDARGSVGNPSMGGVNPPALVLDRNHASG